MDALSGSMLCTGILGSGKTVLCANLIEHLIANNPAPATVVAWWFVDPAVPASLRSRTIAGSIASQLLSQVGAEHFDRNWQCIPLLDVHQMFAHIMAVLSKENAGKRHFVVVDGLDECDDLERSSLLGGLQFLVDHYYFHVFCTCRSNNQQLFTPHLHVQHFITMDVTADIHHFIDNELDDMLCEGHLTLGNPHLIIQIRNALIQGSHGMYVVPLLPLWLIANDNQVSLGSFSVEIDM
jgi:ankyrin repeat domain-containing protein 50